MGEAQSSPPTVWRRVRAASEWFAGIGIVTLILIGVPLRWYYSSHYVWETPFVGERLQDWLYGEPNYPQWVLDYTNNPRVLYNVTWHNNVTWHTHSLAPCNEAKPGTHIVLLLQTQEAVGLYLEDTAICTTNLMDRIRPSCLALHELAHAIDWAERGDRAFVASIQLAVRPCWARRSILPAAAGTPQ